MGSLKFGLKTNAEFSLFIVNQVKTKPNKVILTVMAKVMGTPKKQRLNSAIN